MRLLGLLLVAGALLAASSARSSEPICSYKGDSTREAACLEAELRAGDARINEVYGRIAAALGEAERLTLRDEQRAWIRSRTRDCNLDGRETDRERWFQKVLADREAATCTVRVTQGRIDLLRDRAAGLDAEAKAAAEKQAAAAPAMPPASSSPGPEHRPNPRPAIAVPSEPAGRERRFFIDHYSIASYTSGKWYFETTIDRHAIAMIRDTAFSIGIRGPNGVFGMLVETPFAAAQQPAFPPTTYGVAVDLDFGFLYLRDGNGRWSATPDSNKGMQIILNRRYGAVVTTVPALTLLQVDYDRQLIAINLGERPFQHTIPEGYQPFGGRSAPNAFSRDLLDPARPRRGTGDRQ